MQPSVLTGESAPQLCVSGEKWGRESEGPYLAKISTKASTSHSAHRHPLVSRKEGVQASPPLYIGLVNIMEFFFERESNAHVKKISINVKNVLPSSPSQVVASIWTAAGLKLQERTCGPKQRRDEKAGAWQTCGFQTQKQGLTMVCNIPCRVPIKSREIRL